MTSIQALILGVVQGLTEFFPVSSSGHLVLAQSVLALNPPGVTFEVLVHFATLAAVIAVYHRRVAALAMGVIGWESAALRYVGKLLVASIPIGLIGVFAAPLIEEAFDSAALTAVNLLVTGTIVYATRWLVQRDGRVEPGWGGAVLIGLAQALAILPGISRSGSTVAAALWARTGRAEAAEFSFLLSVPAILGATLLEAPKFANPVASLPALSMGLAAASAFVAGVLAIVLFVRWLRVGRFHLFAYYCWGVGALFLAYDGLIAG